MSTKSIADEIVKRLIRETTDGSFMENLAKMSVKDVSDASVREFAKQNGLEGKMFKDAEGKYSIVGENGRLPVDLLVGKSVSEAFDEMAKIFNDVEMTGVQKSLDEGTGLRTRKQVDEALATSNSPEQRGKAAEAYGGTEQQPIAPAKESKFTQDIKVWATKITVLTGMTFGVLAAIASATSGCYLIDMNTGEKIRKVSGGSSSCQCGGKPPEAQSYTVLKEHATICAEYCAKIENATEQPPDGWVDCQISCACKKKSSTGPVLQKQQYGYKYFNEDAFSTLGNILAGVGKVIKDVTDTALDIADQIMKGIVPMLKWLIPVIVVVVLIAIVVPIVVDASKKKKLGGGGSAGYGWDGWSGTSYLDF